MGYSISNLLPYPTNKPSIDDIEDYKDQFPHVRDYPNGHRIRISNPKPDKINLTIQLSDHVLTEELAAKVPLEDRCEAVSQILCSEGANSCLVPSSVQSHSSKAYNRVFQLDIGISGALLRCEFSQGKKVGQRLSLSFNPNKVGPNGHKAIANLLFGCGWLSWPPIFDKSTFAKFAKITRIDFAIDCTGLRPNELVMRHDDLKGVTLYSSGSDLETIYVRKASLPDKQALVKAYNKTAEMMSKGGNLDNWPKQVTRIEVTRKGLKQKFLEDIFDLPDPFRKLRCGYLYSQGAKSWQKLQLFKCIRREHDIESAIAIMNIPIAQGQFLDGLIATVPNPDLVRPKTNWLDWKEGCKASGIGVLL